uniref:MFS domain-containing protein n=1 Tax=Ganoderma boninense TaxID=34458 RepID=A0A5K1K380_9APHY|nr:MFS domain-containing protein [Ganoderma boninense]
MHLKRGKGAMGDEDMDAEADEDAGADVEPDEEEEEERWKVEVQARFMRALHELDYMGFVRHTGRKPDHVIRTFYDVPD